MEMAFIEGSSLGGAEGQVPDPLRGPPSFVCHEAHINTRDIVQIRRRPCMSCTTHPMGLARISPTEHTDVSCVLRCVKGH